MTTIAARRTTPHRIAGLLRAIVDAVIATYRTGGRNLVRAPAIAAIAVLPEFAQHVIEIRLGMFESVAAFRGNANDPLRWGFGYPKLAGFVIAILLFVRFCEMGSAKRAAFVPPRAILRVILTLIVGAAVSWPFAWLARQDVPVIVSATGQGISFTLQMGIILCLVGALLDDRALSPRRAMTMLLPAAAIMTLLLAAVFVPGQALHMANHKLAIGQPTALVWAIMAFDALWIGLLSSLIGAAMWVGYRSGLTWHGWTAQPDQLAAASHQG